MVTRTRHDDTTKQSLIERLGVLVESRVVRTLLVVTIIVSLLPFREVDVAFRWFFVAAFGAELAVRIPLLILRRERREAGIGELAFILVDLAAFLSFLPLGAWFGVELEWLTFMRLSRLLVLLRFARHLAADLYSIMTRREQLQQFGLVTVAVAALAFVSAVILSQLQIEHDYDGLPRAEDRFADQLWWTFRQLESPDNLVSNLHVHPVLAVLSLGLTITGVFIISFVIGIGANVVEQVVRAERRRTVGYTGHTVVVGPIHRSEVLIREFVRIYSKNRRDVRDQITKALRWLVGRGVAPRAWRLPRMALLGPEPEPPGFLFERGMRWVVYRAGDGADVEALRRIGAAGAKRAILIGDRSAGEDADAITVSTLSALRSVNEHAHVYVEVLTSRNYRTLEAVGQSGRTFLLDVPWFLGLFMLHHLLIPGVERLYRFLLTAEGSELYSHVYLTPDEIDAIVALADEDGMISAAAIAELAHETSTVLIGVFLGSDPPKPLLHDLIPTDGLTVWVNPFATPTDPHLRELGATAGKIPARYIRGLIAVGETYQPVRTLARELVERHVLPKPIRSRTGPPVDHPAPPPREILVVGYGDAVASFTRRLADLARDVRIVVAADDDPRHLTHLEGAFRRAGLRLSRTEAGPFAELANGGRLELRTAPHDPMGSALEELEARSFDAVMFLAESDAVDSDARTMLRVMRIAEHLLNRPGSPPHILAELSSPEKGARLRDQVARAFVAADRVAPRITLVSTEQVRNYFMVHSAFVPGINDVYGQLLGERGQDLIRIPLRGGPRTVSFRELHRALRRQHRIAIGLELESSEVVLNPDADRAYDAVVAVYAIGHTESDELKPQAGDDDE